ncbi:MAG: UDP-N-acetylmuramoyl-tripeptide--D-alanyl-D-alanine ligase [Bacteroidota bacterium]
MDLPQLHQLFLEFPRVSTDTRKIEQHSIFFALKGPNFNGNAFAAEALDKGAAYAVVDEPEYVTTDKIICVEDVLVTLQQLATYHRNHCNAKIISLTGSNGKTTTKELIHAVLSQKFTTIATQGNLNNHIGVPLTLLRITADTEIAVIEMGANHQKEIAFLSGIAQPDFGYITNFGKAHLEGFGGVEGVIKGKSELYDYLLQHNKYVFLNADDPIQKEKLATYSNKIGFSQNDAQYFNITVLATEPFIQFEFENTQVATQLVGDYNFPNCCVAVLMGKYFNVPAESIIAAIASYIPSDNRSQIVEKGDHRIVLDAYNANPTSMKAALESFAKTKDVPKIAFLGDMFELGDSSAVEHQSIADLAEALDFERVYLVGENFCQVTSKFRKFPSFESLKEHLLQYPLEKGVIFIKGSRGMAMERLLDIL